MCIRDSVYAPAKNRLFYSYGKNLAFEINNGKKIMGKLKSNINELDIFKALFPGGSITGAPKESAMKIIDKIENYETDIAFFYLKDETLKIAEQFRFPNDQYAIKVIKLGENRESIQN